jgi:uncharacterized protein (DUF486 family)
VPCPNGNVAERGNTHPTRRREEREGRREEKKDADLPVVRIRRICYLPGMMTYLIPVALLIISNTFMTIAWYGHLKFESKPMWLVILVSWLIASMEYCFQVPANRYGSMHGLSAGTLKVIQEAITLVVFVIFARLYLGEKLAWNYYLGFGCIFLGVFFVFFFRKGAGA